EDPKPAGFFAGCQGGSSDRAGSRPKPACSTSNLQAEPPNEPSEWHGHFAHDVARAGMWHGHPAGMMYDYDHRSNMEMGLFQPSSPFQPRLLPAHRRSRLGPIIHTSIMAPVDVAPAPQAPLPHE